MSCFVMTWQLLNSRKRLRYDEHVQVPSLHHGGLRHVLPRSVYPAIAAPGLVLRMGSLLCHSASQCAHTTWC